MIERNSSFEEGESSAPPRRTDDFLSVSDNDTAPIQDIHPNTWSDFYRMLIEIFRLVWGISYTIPYLIFLLVLSIIRSTENFFSKFIVHPLLSLWQSLFGNGSMLVSNRVDQVHIQYTWDKEPNTVDMMKKTTHYLTFTFFVFFSAWIYIYLYPEFSFMDTFYNVTESMSPSFYQPCHMDVIDRRLSNINIKLEEQSKNNDIFFSETTIDLVTLKENQSKMMAQFDDFHIQLGFDRIVFQKIWEAIDEYKHQLSELPKKTVDELVKRMIVILLQEEDDLKFSPKVSSLIEENKFFSDLALHNGDTMGEYLLQEIKLFIQFLQEHEEPSINVDPFSDSETDIKNLNDYALMQNGASIYFKRTSSSKMDPQYWTRYLFQLAPFIERDAINTIKDTKGCWSLKGPMGYLGILLNKTIQIKYISITHTSEDVETAPKDFEVYGIHKWGLLSEEQFYIGQFQYQNSKQERTQYFRIPDDKPSAGAVLFKFKTNWGNEKRTDICRVGVHA